MAAMRLRLPVFALRREHRVYLHKAQSPYSVNIARGAGRACRPCSDPRIHREVRRRSAGRARDGSTSASSGSASRTSRARPISCCSQAGERAIPIRDALRERGVLVRDRSYEIPGCVRVTIGTRAQVERFLTELEESGDGHARDRVRHGRRAGGGHRILPRDDRRRPSSTSPASASTRDLIQDYKNQGGWNNDWALSQKIAAGPGRRSSLRHVVDYFNQIFIGKNGRRPDPARALDRPRPGLLERLREAFQLGDLHRPPAIGG